MKAAVEAVTPAGLGTAVDWRGQAAGARRAAVAKSRAAAERTAKKSAETGIGLSELGRFIAASLGVQDLRRTGAVV